MPPDSKRDWDCDVLPHIVSFGGIAVAVYFKVMQFTSGGQKGRKFYATADKMSKFLDCDYKACLNAFHRLRDSGWLYEVRDRKTGRPHYIPVLHEDWIQKHPGTCYQGEEHGHSNDQSI